MPSLCAIFFYYKNDCKLKNFLAPSLVCLLGFVIIISGIKSIIDKLRSGYTCFNGLEFSYCHIKTYNFTSSHRNSSHF